MRVGALSVTLAAAAVMASAGCADSESMLFIRQVQARLATGATACVADNTPTSPSLSGGVLDIAFLSRYSAALLVGNQLVGRGNSTQLRTETSRVELKGAIVHALDDAGNLASGPFTVPGTGFIEPAIGSDPSFGLTETVLFQADAAFRSAFGTTPGMVKHYVAVAKVFGRTLGGTDVESGEWQFPIDICFACLVTFPEGTSSSTQTPDCDLPADPSTVIQAPCNPGQDDPLDCRACKEVFQGNGACEP
jgi:hypothetical protein